MIRYTLILALVLMLGSPALADSDWYELDRTAGTTGSILTRAKAGRTYQTTIDATGQSAVIDVLSCHTLKVVGTTVSTTYQPNLCDTLVCAKTEPFLAATTASDGEGFSERSVSGALQIINATNNDIIVLFCGE